MAIRARITAADIQMSVMVVRPATVVVSAGVQAYSTWQKIHAIAQSGYDPWCPFTFDAVTISDAQSYGFDTPKSDAISATDVTSWYLTFNRSASDTVTATDGLATIATMLRTASDAVTATEALAFDISTPRGDAVTVTDSVIAGFQFYQTPNDGVTITDAAIAFDLATPLGDPITVTEATVFSLSRPVGDPATATDSVVAALAMPRSASDSTTVSDSLQIIWRRANVYGETANASPLNSAALNSSTAWVEQWTFNY